MTRATLLLALLVACAVDPSAVDADLDGVTVGDGDCDDGDARVGPHEAEIAYDGVDDDCDPTTPDDDLDGDGWRRADGDCDDTPATGAGVWPGRAEVPYDGIDQDCSGADLVDVDRDGYAGGAAGDDCDDRDPLAHPAGVEVCGDGIDADCDGGDLPCTALDGDGDGFGTLDGDCDDRSALVHPDATEVPYDGVDQDCDPATPDDDLDGDGWRKRAGDCDDDDDDVWPGRAEIPYDGVDQDCSGADLVDVDRDGHAGGGGADCDDRDPRAHPGAVEVVHTGLDEDCDPLTSDTDADGDGHDAILLGGDDCDDFDAQVRPGASEVAHNHQDDDCDPASRDDDLDGDGYGRFTTPTRPGGDCDDGDPNVHPGAADDPYDGVDQDCTGADLVDLDQDGFTRALDCDDGDPAIRPDAADAPLNGIDEDCDGRDGSRPEAAQLPTTPCGALYPYLGASGGGQTLFVATRYCFDATGAYSSAAVGTLLDADGHATPWFVLAPGQNPYDVTWDGTQFVVLLLSASYTFSLLPVTPQGEFGVAKALPAGGGYASAMFSAGGTTLVFGYDGASVGWLFDDALEPIATVPLATYASYGVVASSDDRFLLVWPDYPAFSTRRMVLGHDGEILAPEGPLGPYGYNLSAASDGTGFVVAQTSVLPNAAAAETFAVTADGAVGEGHRGAFDPYDHRVVFAGGRYQHLTIENQVTPPAGYLLYATDLAVQDGRALPDRPPTVLLSDTAWFDFSYAPTDDPAWLHSDRGWVPVLRDP